MTTQVLNKLEQRILKLLAVEGDECQAVHGDRIREKIKSNKLDTALVWLERQDFIWWSPDGGMGTPGFWALKPKGSQYCGKKPFKPMFSEAQQ